MDSQQFRFCESDVEVFLSLSYIHLNVRTTCTDHTLCNGRIMKWWGVIILLLETNKASINIESINNQTLFDRSCAGRRAKDFFHSSKSYRVIIHKFEIRDQYYVVL